MTLVVRSLRQRCRGKAKNHSNSGKSRPNPSWPLITLAGVAGFRSLLSRALTLDASMNSSINLETN
jgi:hypothetical protein